MARRSVFTILVVAVLSLMVISGLVLAVVMSMGDGGGLKLGDRIAIIPIDSRYFTRSCFGNRFVPLNAMCSTK